MHWVTCNGLQSENKKKPEYISKHAMYPFITENVMIAG